MKAAVSCSIKQRDAFNAASLLLTRDERAEEKRRTRREEEQDRAARGKEIRISGMNGNAPAVSHAVEYESA